MRAFGDAGHAGTVREASRLDPKDRSHGAAQLRGSTMTHRDWMLLENERLRIRDLWETFFSEHDLLLCPPAADVAFPQNEQGRRWERMIEVDGVAMPDVEQLIWMGFANMGNLPATVAPIAITASGLPTGVQIVGPQFGDLSTIRFAQLLERDYFRFQAPPEFAE
jgi:amidase